MCTSGPCPRLGAGGFLKRCWQARAVSRAWPARTQPFLPKLMVLSFPFLVPARPAWVERGETGLPLADQPCFSVCVRSMPCLKYPAPQAWPFVGTAINLKTPFFYRKGAKFAKGRKGKQGFPAVVCMSAPLSCRVSRKTLPGHCFFCDLFVLSALR